MNITPLVAAVALNLSGPDSTLSTDSDTPTQQDRVVDRAIALDGIDDFVTVPACEAMRYPGEGGWTLELWVKPVIYPHKNDVTIVGQESVGIDARDPWTLRAHPTHFQFRVDDDHGARDSIRFDMALGVWQHVACVYEHTEVQGRQEHWIAVYVDGNLIERKQTTIEMGSRSDPVYMGALAKTRFCGLLDDVRVWSRGMTQTEVSGAHLGDRILPLHDLRAWWTFDESNGSVAMNSASQEAHAVLGRPHDAYDSSAPKRVARADQP